MLPDHLRAVCFDIGGVLAQVPRGFLAEELAGVLDADLTRIRQLLIEHGKRRRTSAAALAAAVAAGCGMPGETARVEKIIRQRLDDMANPVLSAAGWRICFLSNGIGDTASRPRPEYFSYADLVAHSWEIGYCKPEAGAFRAAEQRMGLAPHQLVSIGDSLRTDVLGALAAGWSAVHLPRTSAPPPSPRIVPTISSLSELLSQMPTRPAGMEIQGS
jgi:FMN phosphatase YigB (HAD superfamily)